MNSSSEKNYDKNLEEYQQRILSMNDYPEKPLNSRLRSVVDAIPAGSSVLDVACGTGRVLHAALSKGCKGRGIEIVGSAVELAQGKGLDVIEGDVDSWPSEKIVNDLLFDKYDVVVFSKCLMYLKTKNDIIDRLQTKHIIIFQGNPGSVRNRFSGESKIMTDWNLQAPYHLKDGTEQVMNGVGSLAKWGASYGYDCCKTFHGGLWARSLVVRLSRSQMNS